MTKYKLKVLLAQSIAVLTLLFIWEFGTRKGFINGFIFSSPTKVLTTLFTLIKSGELIVHLEATLIEIVVSFGLGIVIAFFMSIIMYMNKFLADTLDPFLTMLNSLPKVALGPIIIIWVGANTNSIIVMALLINVIISIITIYNGFVHTDPLKLKLFKSFKASKWQILSKLVIPSNISTIISALKIDISLTLIGVIMGEFLVSRRGIGYLILYGTQVFNLNLVITGIFVLIVVSYIIYKGVSILDRFINKDRL